MTLVLVLLFTAIALTSTTSYHRSGIEGVVHCQAVDFSDGCGSKFEITIVSAVFSGLKIIAQHRLVHKAIEEERKHIHAITLHTKTPDSWQSEQQEA